MREYFLAATPISCAVLTSFALLRRDGRPRLLVIQASSGAGKSSYLAGRPLAAARPRSRFCTACHCTAGSGHIDRSGRFRPKTRRAVVAPGSAGQCRRHSRATHVRRRGQGRTASFAKLMASLQPNRRSRNAASAIKHARAPALLLAIDQAEELFASDDAEESQRALFLLAKLMLRSAHRRRSVRIAYDPF